MLAFLQAGGRGLVDRGWERDLLTKYTQVSASSTCSCPGLRFVFAAHSGSAHLLAKNNSTVLPVTI